jgi:hypothetical protein
VDRNRFPTEPDLILVMFRARNTTICLQSISSRISTQKSAVEKVRCRPAWGQSSFNLQLVAWASRKKHSWRLCGLNMTALGTLSQRMILWLPKYISYSQWLNKLDILQYVNSYNVHTYQPQWQVSFRRFLVHIQDISQGLALVANVVYDAC